MSEPALIGMIAALHVVALSGGAVLVLALARTDSNRSEADGRRGGDDPPRPPRPPTLGPPLLDARPARVRLREPARLAVLIPCRERRRPPPRPVPAPPTHCEHAGQHDALRAGRVSRQQAGAHVTALHPVAARARHECCWHHRSGPR